MVGLAPLLSIKPQASKGVIASLALASLVLGYLCYSWQVERVQLQVMALLTWGLAFWVVLTHVYGLVVTRAQVPT